MKINTKDFQVIEGHNVELKKRPTTVKPFYKSRTNIKRFWSGILKN